MFTIFKIPFSLLTWISIEVETENFFPYNAKSVASHPSRKNPNIRIPVPRAIFFGDGTAEQSGIKVFFSSQSVVGTTLPSIVDSRLLAPMEVRLLNPFDRF